MERKSIGGFIAALRKANGMTQKELAERLNVSDKTVSRWERDDGVPDLSVIPVIAEIFDVTCDELLRGERKPLAERQISREEGAPTAKGEKQRRRLLTISLSKYRTRSFIAMGVAATGLIAAMIGNLGFLRAYIGFLAGAVFYLAGVICQAIFVNGAFLAVSDESLSGEEVGGFKCEVIRLAEWSVGLTAVLLGVSVPLVIFPNGTYVGLSGESWILYGGIFGAITLVLYSIACYILNAALLKKGICYLDEQKAQVYWKNHVLQRRTALSLAAVLAATCFFHQLTTSVWNAETLSKGVVFHDYESFVAYMEQDIPYSRYSSSAVMQVVPNDSVAYYDEFGNEVSKDEALREELRIYDGTEQGKVVCEYVRRNQSVRSILYSSNNGSALPITVITYDDYRGGQAKVAILHVMFATAYCVEILITAAVYFRKRTKC